MPDGSERVGTRPRHHQARALSWREGRGKSGTVDKNRQGWGTEKESASK